MVKNGLIDNYINKCNDILYTLADGYRISDKLGNDEIISKCIDILIKKELIYNDYMYGYLLTKSGIKSTKDGHKIKKNDIDYYIK